MKPVRLSRHAQDNAVHRGTSDVEVADAIHTTPWADAGRGRLECRKDFSYDGEWNGRHYGTKQVRPIFVDEDAEIVVVTVYVYFF